MPDYLYSKHKTTRRMPLYGKSLIDNLKDCFLNQYPWEFSLHRNTMSTSGAFKFFITYLYIWTLNEEPTDPGKSLLGLSNLSFTWNFLDRLKQTFLQINLFVAWKHRARLNSATIDWFVENWEACSLPSALQLTYCQISCTWLVCSLDQKHKGKGM